MLFAAASQIFRDFLNFVHLTSDWTKSNGTQFETEIPCTNSGISVLVSSDSFSVSKVTRISVSAELSLTQFRFDSDSASVPDAD